MTRRLREFWRSVAPRITRDNREVSPVAKIRGGVSIWNGTMVREGAHIGYGSSLGRNVYIGPGVIVGENVRIQNGAQVFEPVEIGNGSFIGPNVVFTNDRTPRAVKDQSLDPIGESDWQKTGIVIGIGASIGACAVLVSPLRIGNWALIGAGSVVTQDVPDHALVFGNPARQRGWVDFNGDPLEPMADGKFRSTTSQIEFRVIEGGLEAIG